MQRKEEEEKEEEEYDKLLLTTGFREPLILGICQGFTDLTVDQSCAIIPVIDCLADVTAVRLRAVLANRARHMVFQYCLHLLAVGLVALALLVVRLVLASQALVRVQKQQQVLLD